MSTPRGIEEHQGLFPGNQLVEVQMSGYFDVLSKVEWRTKVEIDYSVSSILNFYIKLTHIFYQ